MTNALPDPHDYVLETVPDPSGQKIDWAIMQGGEIRRTYESQHLAIRMVRHFARMSHCRAWLAISGAAPLLLTL